MSIVYEFDLQANFDYDYTEIEYGEIGPYQISRSRYAYFGYGTYNGSTYTYTPVDSAWQASGTLDENVTSQYGYMWFRLNANMETMASAYETFYQFSLSSGAINESAPTGTYLVWYVTFSNTLRDNLSSILSDPACGTIAFKFLVYNPPYTTYTYHVYFRDGATLIYDLAQAIRSRSAWGKYPRTLRIPNAKNATDMGYIKPGKIGIGWDTSSSATTVVYGGEGTGDLTIPADTIPYNNGLTLYSVWKDGLSLKIVTAISGTTPTLADITDIKMVVGFNGTDPQLVSIVGGEIKQSV